MSGLLAHVFKTLLPNRTDVDVSANRWNDFHAFTGGSNRNLVVRDTSDATYGARWAAMAEFLYAYFAFGGSALAFVTGNAYPAGATFDKLAPGTVPMFVDPAVLVGTFVMEYVAHVDNGVDTPTCCLVDLDDGAPNTPLTGSEASGTAGTQTGTRFRSGTITFPAGGTAKQFGVKAKTDNAAGHVTLVSAVLIKTG